MPELPEVETIVRDLAPRLTHKTLHAPVLFKSDVLRGVTAARLRRALDGARVARVARRAKHVVLELAGGLRVVIQPRMTGSLVVHDRRLRPAERRYAVLTAAISGGGIFVYRDVRRLGTITLLDETAWRAYDARIGPEPLARGFNVGRFRERLGATRQAVKKALMDQRRLAGVGNIYANEALFLARIDPSRRTDRLSPGEIARLYRATRRVLAAAVAAQGTTVRDYRTGTGQTGRFQFSLRVYGKGGHPCPRCGARLSTTHAIDGRATTFCWRCQSRR